MTWIISLHPLAAVAYAVISIAGDAATGQASVVSSRAGKIGWTLNSGVDGTLDGAATITTAAWRLAATA